MGSVALNVIQSGRRGSVLRHEFCHGVPRYIAVVLCDSSFRRRAYLLWDYGSVGDRYEIDPFRKGVIGNRKCASRVTTEQHLRVPLGSGRYQEPNVPEAEVGNGLVFLMWEVFGPLPLEGGIKSPPSPVGPRGVGRGNGADLWMATNKKQGTRGFKPTLSGETRRGSTKGL